MNILPARRLLVPLDLAPAAPRALEWARRLAAPGARFEALYVYDAPPAPVLGLPAPGLPPRSRARLAARLKAEAPWAQAWKVEEGDAAAAISRRAKGADLVVMATHGRAGFDRFLLGSVSETVARDCPAPVLAARAPFPKGGVKSVLVPVNLAPYSRAGLELGALAAAALGARLTVLHVAAPGSRGPNPRFFLNGMIERLPAALRAATEPELLLRSGDPVKEILVQSRRHGLLALAAHRKSLLGDLVLGTTVERVLRHSPAPVLAAPSGR